MPKNDQTRRLIMESTPSTRTKEVLEKEMEKLRENLYTTEDMAEELSSGREEVEACNVEYDFNDEPLVDEYKPEHPQVQAVVNEQVVEVDEQLLEVLRYLWREGIVTFYSCQGNPGADINDPDSRALNSAYIFMQDDGRWRELVEDLFWRQRKLGLNRQEWELITRMFFPTVKSSTWVEHDHDDLAIHGQWVEEIISPSPSTWIEEHDHNLSDNRGKGITVRFPNEDVPLLESVLKKRERLIKR